MSIIHKRICDECGREHDLTQQHYGPFPNEFWQELLINDKHMHTPVTKNVCSIDCVIKFLQRYKKK